jgi:hypothetical protein
VDRTAALPLHARRRDDAARSSRMHRGAVLTDGTATIGGREGRWSPVRLYRLAGERVVARRPLPLDPAALGRMWA